MSQPSSARLADKMSHIWTGGGASELGALGRQGATRCPCPFVSDHGVTLQSLWFVLDLG
uniref:Uncharacterized protein n=1 Tax=Zea mays TaxID=4577 RepID=B6UFM8_MAIZE|nr:hypothetical protein [Zea mays]